VVGAVWLCLEYLRCFGCLPMAYALLEGGGPRMWLKHTALRLDGPFIFELDYVVRA